MILHLFMYDMNRFKWMKVGFMCVFLLLMWGCKKIKDEESFLKNEVNGVIIKLKYEGRDVYTLFIKKSKTNEIVDYSLRISWFVKENKISEMDSIGKNANDHNVYFYRKVNGHYRKISKLYYY